jgi:hypothetical protein
MQQCPSWRRGVRSEAMPNKRIAEEVLKII